MQFHELKPKTQPSLKKRVGRGGTRGKTSGRGEKGQGARAGRKYRPAERDLYMRLPKLRGVKNLRLSTPAFALNVGAIAKLGIQDLTKKVLIEKGLIATKKVRVKVLAMGEIKIPVTIEKGIEISQEARKKIEAAGGKVE
ncbi:50S ribosomal protein L15 [Candidatus Parcubacteria bacterium]|jgi:large subunit ribosomal protein L15|nr:MAG: 50S ribosomal protein L15 [Candidatus Parcubacteria bacterium]